MARPRKAVPVPELVDGVEPVDEIPPKGKYSPWAERLAPLVGNPQQPYKVWEAESDEQARQAVDNLSRRLLVFPHPDHDWAFHARGCIVYAIYKGRGRQRARRVRRA